DLEDELIITVIATGFDSAYFHEQAAQMEAPGVMKQPVYEAVDAINMDLDQTDVSASFAEETPHDIWNTPPVEEDESDTPAFLRRRKKNKSTDES
ncbi:MAG: cell division protein FtsZ, partial [Candidatus Saccharimonadales bacterium]